MKRGGFRLGAMLLAGALLWSGCARQMKPLPQEITGVFNPGAVDVPAGTEPAKVLTGVETLSRVASLVLEGYSDDETMETLRAGLTGRGTEATFLLTGESAADHAEVVRAIAQDGYPVGNAGLTTHGEKNDARRLRQLRRAQSLLTEVLGKAPTQFRLAPEEEGALLPLQLGTLCGLTEALAPEIYLNYRSFRSYEEAVRFVRMMPRGSLMCFKIGQELTEGEYGHPIGVLDEKPAIDPPPSLSKAAEQEEAWRAGVDNALWLVDALAAEGYTLLPPAELAVQKPRSLGQLRELTAQELTQTDPSSWPALQTDHPLGLASGGGEMDGTVLVGDGVMASVADAVEARRAQEADYLPGVSFLCAEGLTAANALWGVSESSRHPVVDGVKTTVEDALGALQPRRVLVMLGLGDLAAGDVDAYIADMTTLLCLIRAACPEAELCLVSLPPVGDARVDGAGNEEIFAANLALCRLAMRSGLPFLDAAWALRGPEGALLSEYALEGGGTGARLSPEGAQALLDFVQSHLPE